MGAIYLTIGLLPYLSSCNKHIERLLFIFNAGKEVAGERVAAKMVSEG